MAAQLQQIPGIVNFFQFRYDEPKKRHSNKLLTRLAYYQPKKKDPSDIFLADIRELNGLLREAYEAAPGFTVEEAQQMYEVTQWFADRLANLYETHKSTHFYGYPEIQKAIFTAIRILNRTLARLIAVMEKESELVDDAEVFGSFTRQASANAFEYAAQNG